MSPMLAHQRDSTAPDAARSAEALRSISAAPLIGRVSRQELALNNTVWFMTGIVYLVIGLACIAIPLILPQFTPERIWPLAALLILAGLVLMALQPPSVGSIGNHLVLACTYVCTALGMVAFAPNGSISLAAAMFIGPLTAVRLVDRREIAAHYAAATALLATPLLLGLCDAGTTLTFALAIPATVALGFCCMIVLEAAEKQGDELELLIRRDPLTGVGNRRLLTEQLDFELRRHARGHIQFSVLMLGLNEFRALNERLGRGSCDELLMEVAGVLRAGTLESETIVRTAGDEFCLLLPETSFNMAASRSDSLRAAIANLGGREARLGASVGIATFPTDAVHAGVLIDVADERMRENQSVRRFARRPASQNFEASLDPLTQLIPREAVAHAPSTK
jgi:diguanylate cyclase (GGDEF)-like protein